MQKRVYGIMWGVYINDALNSSTLVFLQRADPYLPERWKSGIDEFKCVGGGIEDGESPIDALKREIKEEEGEWFEMARIPATKWLELSSQDDTNIFYGIRVDVGPASYALYKNKSTESQPVSIPLKKLIDLLKTNQSNRATHGLLQALENLQEKISKINNSL